MNVELLLKVKKHILAKPSRLYMNRFILRDKDLSEYRTKRDKRYVEFFSKEWNEKGKRLAPSCGTVGCIAGWVVLLNDEKAKNHRVIYKAMELLNINNTEASKLFYVSNWPSKFKDEYLLVTKNKIKAHARIVGQVIDFFIKTNGTMIEEV